MSGEMIAIKAVATGGVSATILALTIGDVEFMSLLCMGVFASLSSFLYDWGHREPPRTFGIREFSCILKYILYGVTFQFTVFYLGMNHGSEYVKLGNIAWGLIAGLTAGSAVAIVNWIMPKIKDYIEKAIGKVKK